MTWLTALAMVVIGIFTGAVSSIFIVNGRPLRLWAGFVSGVFFLAMVCVVIFNYSWMFTAQARAIAEYVALASAVTGVVFGMRSSG